ncbi:ataxia telangectasia mutated family protein [Rhizoctonia solani]|uniref:Serine/threonine-protein kinase Tel1 n=1 Tax=Rhizoctonia solani TaxID=456999 RepID=A0A0K6G7K3_9AGAM|nr:ataxia telangectasia mutated family protein [Rhizoctonia solani]
MSQDISTALELLVGKTIRDRTEGMRMLQDALKRDSVVNNIDERGDGKAWLYIFQKVFPLVLDEREKYMKSSGEKAAKRTGADAAARLEKSANFVRWLTERSVSNLNRRVTKPLVAHLAQMIIHNGTVFLPVALSYVKALRTIVEFRPHMDHLDADTWSHLMAISFAAVLGTRLSHSLDLEGLSGTARFNADEGSDDETETIASPRRKRQRIMSPPMPTNSAVHSKTARLDQIEFVALIRALLTHPNASLMMTSIPGAPQAILGSFSQYFVRYPSEGTAHQDAIWALNSALLSLELNRSQVVIKFGAQLWFPLLDLWTTKARAIKEGLVLTFNLLMPLMMESDNTQFPKADAIARLNAVLDGEPSSRSGLEGLSLDTLRLQLSQDGRPHGAFETTSFRHGADFNPSHALSWVALQLQADCIAKMLTLTGSASASDTPRRGGKSLRLSNPVLSLLSQIKAIPSTRNYRLQVLLFLIDRHWDKLSLAVQSEVCSTLSAFFSQDDHTSSSWAFICCAAIACAQKPASKALSSNQISEEITSFWTHAIRKTTVTLECRAACHAANAITQSGHLDDQTLFKDIEAFAADLLVQGPAFPHDSVCAFLIECLRIAGRDAGLYRKQLEDKVLGWLSESWSATETVRNNARARLDTYSLGDILELLQTACVMTRRILPIAVPLLPDCVTTDVMLERHQTDLIRDFLIYARIPAFRPDNPRAPGTRDATGPSLLQNAADIPDKDLTVPNDRARKSSAFLLKSLDALLAEWDISKDPTAMSREAARRAADLACLALWFEASLVSDGMRANTRVIKAACSLIQRIIPCISASRWTADERATMLLPFDVLINDGEDTVEHTPWKGILDPDVDTGIKRRALAQMMRGNGPTKEEIRIRRGLLQKIWRSPDAQDIFADLSRFLRQSIHGLKLSNSGEEKATGVDADGFSEIRTVNSESNVRAADNWTSSHASSTLISFATRFLTAVPTFQSPKLEPAQDEDILGHLQLCDGPAFFTLAPEVFECIRRQYLYASHSELESVLDHLGELLKSYAHPRCEKMQLVVVTFLECTMPLWIQEDNVEKDFSVQSRVLLHWLSDMLVSQKILSWKARDKFTVLLSRYIALDPQQSIWSTPSHDDDPVPPEHLPGTMLVNLGTDCDIRVRVRAAEATAGVFRSLKYTDTNPMEFYRDVQAQLSTSTDDFEGMLTRFMALGNVMVVSSSVRRGPYWHLLEACYHSTAFSRHMESVLIAVAERMGLANLSQLFEAYASQIAYSTCLAKNDLAQIPSHLLGYKSMEERIEESFRLVGPTLLLVGGLREPISHGIMQFQSLCKTIGISESQGLRNCFHDVIGLSIVSYHYESLDKDTHRLSQEATADLKDVLLKRANDACPPEEIPQDYLIRVAPQIVVSIARTIDGAPDEDIVRAFHLQAKGNAAKDFEAFQYYWGDDDFPVHDPVLPAFGPQTVIASLFWFLENHSALFVESHLAYHVAHHLFTAINRSPLVNEQLRLLRALSVVVACLKPFRKDWILLRTLIHGYSLLLTQPDLARMAQSALEWCFLFVPRHVTAITASSPRLEVLGRMGRIAYDYTRESDDFMRHLGDKLMDWVEGVTAKLEKQASNSTGDGQTLYPEILNVLALWPRELKYSELVLRAEELDSDNMSYILQHYASSTSKFRTVHRLLSITHQDTHYDDARPSTFAKADFWHLKSCIPSREEVQTEDAAAFTELLFLNKGNIRALTSDRHDAHSVDAIHRSYAAKNKRDSTSTSPLSAILIVLFDLVYSEDASKVFTAYQTIGRLSNLEVDLANFPGTPSISRGVQQERSFYPRHAEMPLTIQARSLDELLLAEDLKNSVANDSSWVRTLSSYFCAVLSTINSQDFFAQLVDIIETDETIAKQLLPVLIHAVLQHEDHHLGIPKDQYGAETARSQISTYFTELLTKDSTCTAIVDCLIQVVLHLRNFYPLSGVEPRDMLAYDHWLDVDYRLLAEGALRCGAYTTGILFLELYEDRAHDFPDNSVMRSTEEILYDIYSHIDEPDGFYGIKSDDIQSHLIRRFHHEGRWDKAFQFLGAMFESPGASVSSTPGVLHSLQSFGFENMTMTMINGSKNAQVPPTDDGYTLGWRTETWDLPVAADNLPPGSALYYALRAVHQERDPAVVQSRVYDARGNEMERLRALGREDMSHIKKSIRALMCIGEVRKFLDHPQGPKALLQTFAPLSPDFEFDDYESLVATRLSLLRANIHKNRAMQIGNIDSEDTKKLLEYEQDLLIKLSQAARDSQKNQIALNSIIRAGNGAQKHEFEFVQEYASVMWANQEQKTAVGFLRQFLGRPEDKRKISSKDAASYAQLLSLLGTWVSDARLEQPMDIREKYFGRAEKMLEGLHQHPSHAIVYHRYAKFAAEQYYTALDLSPEFKRLKARMDRKKNELDQISETLRRSVANAQLTQQQRKSQALLKSDTEQFDRHTKSQRVFLEQAIEMYARCLVADDSENNDTIIRFCSLWFANFSDSALNMSVLRGALQQIPSHKFVFLAHQISARLSTTSDPSHSNIRNLMARLCHDHPFHTLYQVYGLASASLGGAGATVNRRQSRAAADLQLQTKRDEAARVILEKLQRDTTIGRRVIQFTQLCNACLQWAKYSLKQDKALKDSKSKVVPQHMELAKLKDLDVPVSTAFTPIDLTCRYEDNIVRVSRYGSRFSTAGGINLPKINDCVGEDGERYKQLFKGEGEDDLRQDAVMEQVFELVNILLKRDRSSKRRNLRVRTYKVIPLASQAGLLEFVTNTMPIGGWLLNAHKKYNPKDWQPLVCTEHLRKARDTRKPQALIDTFMEIRKHFKPVMRHFFTDAHKLPTAWFDMRLNYQRSVATTSIVGHVLGLGDRHLSNILIHNVTGEVVHIDLGIAFDQGRLLPIPETVPFRLTADIVDGLGSTGTEGVFRRCAEETLRVLRDQASVIKTILEVFNHDPLHSWSAAPVKIKHIQGSADTDMDGAGLDSAEAEAAERAILSVSRKLDTSMSVEYTVNDLIATATDPVNLSQLFVGWNPHV